jgi:hypothetical protein
MMPTSIPHWKLLTVLFCCLSVLGTYQLLTFIRTKPQRTVLAQQPAAACDGAACIYLPLVTAGFQEQEKSDATPEPPVAGTTDTPTDTPTDAPESSSTSTHTHTPTHTHTHTPTNTHTETPSNTTTETPSYTPTTPPVAQEAPDDNDVTYDLDIPLDNTASRLDFVSYPGGDTEDRVAWDVLGMNSNPSFSGGRARLRISASCFGENIDEITFTTGGQTYMCGEEIVDKEITFGSKTGSVVIEATGGDGTYVQWVLTGTATRIN